jgi:hypothetical protein
VPGWLQSHWSANSILPSHRKQSRALLPTYFLIFVHYAQPLTHGSFFNMRFLAILLTLEGYGYEDCPTSGYLLGEWSGEEPRCIATYCPIFQMAQGWVKLEGRQPGDRAMVGCNPGFQISGVSLVVCHVRQELIHMYFCYSKHR